MHCKNAKDRTMTCAPRIVLVALALGFLISVAVAQTSGGESIRRQPQLEKTTPPVQAPNTAFRPKTNSTSPAQSAAPIGRQIEAPPFLLSGPIGVKYAAVGGAGGPLGTPIGIEADALYGGRFHFFRQGRIYWHPEIGEAFVVWGAIDRKHSQLGGVEYGYPITDERTTPDGRGRYNHFRALHLPGKPELSIYWTPETGAQAVYGLIRDAWASSGWERGELGYPISDEFQDGEFRRSNFERGHILWSPRTGIRIVKAGATITAQRPPNLFGTLLVNGIEVAVKDRVIVGNPLFLSENRVCGEWKARLPELNAWFRSEAVSRINQRLGMLGPDYGVRESGTHVNFSAACGFVAEVSQACQDSITINMRVPGNMFQFYVMTPFTARNGLFGDSDPKFIVRADIDLSARIQIPTRPDQSLRLSQAQVKLSNVRPDSHNVAGDMVKRAVEIGSQFLVGEDIIATLSQDRMFRLDTIGVQLKDLAANVRSIPAQYRIDSCVGNSQVLRLNGTDVPLQNPIVR